MVAPRKLLSRLEETYSLKKHRVPWAITALRVVALPILIYSFNQEIKVATYALFVFAILTDFLDGYVAKKYQVTSQLGAYFDASADFLFVWVMFLVFVNKGFYSVWILLLIILAFLQFILPSIYLKKTSYDPVGKYYGSVLYTGVGLTLLFSGQLVYSIVTVGVVGFTGIFLVSRAVYFLRSANIHSSEG